MREKIEMLETNRKMTYKAFLSASILLLFIALYELYYKTGSFNLPWLQKGDRLEERLLMKKTKMRCPYSFIFR